MLKNILLVKQTLSSEFRVRFLASGTKPSLKWKEFQAATSFGTPRVLHWLDIDLCVVCEFETYLVLLK